MTLRGVKAGPHGGKEREERYRREDSTGAGWMVRVVWLWRSGVGCQHKPAGKSSRFHGDEMNAVSQLICKVQLFHI